MLLNYIVSMLSSGALHCDIAFEAGAMGHHVGFEFFPVPRVSGNVAPGAAHVCSWLQNNL